MKYKLIKELYDCFYTPPELSAPRQEIEDCHKALIEMLEKPERRLVLQIILYIIIARLFSLTPRRENQHINSSKF